MRSVGAIETIREYERRRVGEPSPFSAVVRQVVHEGHEVAKRVFHLRRSGTAMKKPAPVRTRAKALHILGVI
jgi:hypothetical protein